MGNSLASIELAGTYPKKCSAVNIIHILLICHALRLQIEHTQAHIGTIFCEQDNSDYIYIHFPCDPLRYVYRVGDRTIFQEALVVVI
jgi:hypothetical protein